jgi:hypothetical protein
LDIVETLEINKIPKSTVIYGTHHLARRKTKLYNHIFFKRKKTNAENNLFEILNLSDGTLDFLDMANKKNFLLLDYKKLIDNMKKEKLIRCW